MWEDPSEISYAQPGPQDRYGNLGDGNYPSLSRAYLPPDEPPGDRERITAAYSGLGYEVTTLTYVGTVVCDFHNYGAVIWEMTANAPRLSWPIIPAGFYAAGGGGSIDGVDHEYTFRRQIPADVSLGTLIPTDHCYGLEHQGDTVNSRRYLELRNNWGPGDSYSELLPRYPIDGTCYPMPADGAKLLVHSFGAGSWVRCHWCTAPEGTCRNCLCGLR